MKELLILIFNLILLLCILIFFGTAILGGLLAAPWVPVKKKDIKRLLDLAQIKPGEKVYDLGCGEGRILIQAVKSFQAKGYGIEVSLFFYFLAKLKIFLLGLNKKIKIIYGNFFRQDLGQADVIVCFLTPRAMKKLKLKLERELKPGARIVSYAFKFPSWSGFHQISKPQPKDVPIHFYRVE